MSIQGYNLTDETRKIEIIIIIIITIIKCRSI
jgi:hypothetical protein